MKFNVGIVANVKMDVCAPDKPGEKEGQFKNVRNDEEDDVAAMGLINNYKMYSSNDCSDKPKPTNPNKPHMNRNTTWNMKVIQIETRSK